MRIHSPLLTHLLLLSGAFAPFTAGADPDMLTETRLEIQPVPMLESLDSIQLEPLSLEPLNLNVEGALLERGQISTPTPSPMPKWPEIRRNETFPLFALTRLGGEEVGVELLSFGIGTDLDASLTEQILKHRPSGTDSTAAPTRFDIEGALVSSVFKALKLGPGATLYVAPFDSEFAESVSLASIRKLSVSVIEAGDPRIQVSIPLPKLRIKGDELLAGIAVIATESPFRPGARMRPIKWDEAPALLSASELHEIASSLVPDDEKLAPLPATWKSFASASGALVEMRSPFRGEHLMHTLTGYFWKSGGEMRGILSIYNVSDAGYSQFPKPLLAGAVLKGYRQLIVLGSSGMGDCGRFVVETNNGEVFQVPVRCKAVGC